ncbi:MAG: hypothetical protein GX591_06935 [Planctomycetes bacterium]|nr:hypothetical protein [Planctomycetota bacterium]
MADAIRIKPHHFIDILTSLGTGRRDFQPHPYGHAVHTVSERILADPDTLLEMELGADDICAPCSHNIQGLCDDVIDTSFRPLAPPGKREWNLLLDRRWCERLGLAPGDRLTARRFARLAGDRMGDITDIYREIPADRTRLRASNLRKGIDWILNTDGAPGCSGGPKG